jgi:ParB-like chromosome segregation protein Spo0J
MNNSQYFYRTVIFTRKDNEIALTDINQPENTTPLDEWLGTVVSLADGEHTIQELIDYMRGRYQAPPANLEETVHSVIERLIEGNLIKLSEEAVTLPYYLAAPIEELDLEQARKEISRDGYTVN